jgi:HSP20 family molecular chaperone IbpA
MPAKEKCGTQAQEIVRFLELPFEVDPSRVTTRFSHCMLEISLRRVESHHAATLEPVTHSA